MARGKRRAARERPEIEASARRDGIKGPNALGNYSVCCPYCLKNVGYADELFKLTIKLSGETQTTKIPLSPESGAFNCYRCAAHGLADFRWIGEVSDLPDDAAPAPPPELGPPESFQPIAGHLFGSPGPLAPYVAYLQRRGVLANAIAAGAGACTRGRFAGRVVIPAKTGGRWVGFSARVLDNREPRYLYPEGMERRKMLWGLEHLPPAPSPAWLVEGVFDALPLFPHAPASYGKNVTDEQIEVLAGLGRPIVVCLDGDAWVIARSLAARLQLRGVDATWCALPPGADPGSLGWNVARYLVPPK